MKGCVTKKGNRYYVVVDVGYDASGRRKRKWHGGYGTKKEAERAAASIVNSIHTGSYVAPERRKISEFLVCEWLPAIESSVKPSTFDSYKRNIRLHIEPTLGHIP